MSSNNSAACQSCRFFDEHKTNAGQGAGDEGLCRFNPPVSQPEPQGHGLWPVVASKDWCGHFAADVTPAE
ncbi:hypothetical protein ASG52_05985 [Methylobacterium sp. Leaf456]|uniref:hypothetical protein n=1 Tax=Methylobacterium sp. Leaf456 TaxID=1736382 RepID=UPI0006F259B6|nr:hypothetical protein [Methylobacterium sp. Leaf456]KQT50368.1 hypothetical protein ASG52_05985 [Methylobacterium sp. Leaf456]